MPWRPGALELLTSLRDAGVPCALVSASYRVLLDAALGQLPAGTFAVSVAGDEVSQGKPHPEPYEKACAELGGGRPPLRGDRGLRHRGPFGQRRRRRGDGHPEPGRRSRRLRARRIVRSLTELDVAGVAELLGHADDPV